MIYPYLILYFVSTLFFSADPYRSSEQEYYRGIYDVCVYEGIKAGHSDGIVKKACSVYVKRAVKGDWYKKDSSGWSWPLPASGEQGG